MATRRITHTALIGGLSFTGTRTTESEVILGARVALPAAIAGTLTTRTSDTEGIITLPEGHGLQSPISVGVFWAGGRRLVVSATIVDQAMTISLGAGDNLPAQATAVTVATPVPLDITFTAAMVTAIGVAITRGGAVDFYNGATSEWVADVVAGVALIWDVNGFGDCPFAQDIISAAAYNASAAGAATVSVGVDYET